MTLEPLEDRRLLTTIAGWDGGGLAGEGESVSRPFAPGELLIRFEAHTTPQRRQEILNEGGFTIIRSIPNLDMAWVQLPVQSPDELDESRQWTLHPDIKYAEPNFTFTIDQVIPSDTFFGQLYGLHNTGQTFGQVDADIDAPEAWEITQGSRNVVVAVIDTGLDYAHPDIFPNAWRNPGEIPNDFIDNDGNGVVDDIFGFDAVNLDGDPMDDHGHGTHVAGTIGAKGNNGTGVTGVNWDVQLMAVKNCDQSGACATADSILAIDYATRMKTQFGINVVLSNNSWGGPGISLALQDAVRAHTNADILFVAAAGNGGADGLGDNNDALPNFPSDFPLPGVMSVAATDDADLLAVFSNYGPTQVDLAAPGVSILSTQPNLAYGLSSGTSMASPHVAGVAALLKAADPSLTMLQLKDLIMRGVDPIPGLAGRVVTGGRLNALNSLSLLQAFEVRGVKWQDDNANGVRESFEVGLPNFTIYLDVNGNGVLDANEPSAITGADGSYTLSTNLAPGTYTVAEVQRPNFVQTFPRGNGRHVISVANRGDVVAGVDFGNRPAPGAVSGRKWHDLDGNGLQDIGEPGVSGVFIYVDLDNNGMPGVGEPAAMTNDAGTYRIPDVPSGTRIVREVLQPGWQQTSPTPNGFHTIVVSPNAETRNVNFGNRLGIDFGDAPPIYPVTLAANGARHGLISEFFLGPSVANGGVGVDAEADGQPSVDALGDDNAGVDDEDGVIFPTPLFAGTAGTAQITVTTGANSPGLLQGWIDFNQNGSWADPGDRIFQNVRLGQGTHTLTFAIPAGAALGDTFARFRYGYENNLGATGPSVAGEVEDYRVTILGNQPVASDDSFEVNQNSVENVLSVLANDFPSSQGPLSITAVGTPSRGGTVTIGLASQTVRYTPAPNFFGTETFTYTVSDGAGGSDTALVTVVVAPLFVDPMAVDDSFFVSQNSSNNALDVLANDLPGQNGPLTIAAIVAQPTGGTATIDNQGTADPSDDVIRYTPNTGFGSTDQFMYTVVDSAGIPSTAEVTVHVNPGDESDDLVGMRLETTDLSGAPISTISIGQQFNLNIYVDDLRSNPAQGGVFSAYLDVLYEANHVSVVRTTTGQMFQIDYRTPYTAQPSGNASVPGLIDEVGAVSNSIPPVGANERLAFVITLQANVIGQATFSGDPADIVPNGGQQPPPTSFHEVTLYGDPNPVPATRIRFNTLTLDVVGSGTPPTAVDDSFQVAAIGTTLDVLANDIKGGAGIATITNASTPANGTTTIDNNGTPNNPADDRIRYVPNAGFTGTDQFTYTIRNDIGLVDSATVTVHVTPGSELNDRVAIRLATTDVNGNPISSIAAGTNFQVRAFVEDIRAVAADPGVFSVYMDLLYNSGLASVVTDANNPFGFAIQFNQSVYGNGRLGTANIPGLINEVGAIQTDFNQALGPDEFEVFRITFRAIAPGQAEFKSDPADEPANEITVFSPPDRVAVPEVRYGTTSITIAAAGGTSSFTNPQNPLDVNGDSIVSPLDALLLINNMNTRGARDLSVTNGAEGESLTPFYYLDVDADGFLTASDALRVINYLNQRSPAGSGEGEASLLAEGEAGDELLTLPPASLGTMAASPSTGGQNVAQLLPLSFQQDPPKSGGTAVQSSTVQASSQKLVNSAPEDRQPVQPAVESSLGDQNHTVHGQLDQAAREIDEDEPQSLDELLDDLAADVHRVWVG